MAHAQLAEVFSCSADQFYEVIADYSKYPEFLDEVLECRVEQEESGRKLVRFQITIIKKFQYTLWMTEAPKKGIRWEFAGGDLFKTLQGSWDIEVLESQQCRATYKVDATFGLFVPGPIAKAAVSVNLPNMMASYKKRVRELYG